MSVPRTVVPVLVSALTAPLCAQGVPPGLSSPFARSTVFDTTRAPFAGCMNNLQQIAFQVLPCNAPDEFTVTMTAGNLCATYGGSGAALGLIEGTYNVTTGVVTLTTNANAIQTPGSQHFNLQLEPGTGRYCVFDRFSSGFAYQGIFFSSRPACGMPFGAAVAVQNVASPFASGADPSLGYVGGQLKLFYAATINGATSIYMDGLDLTNLNAPRALGTPVLVRPSSRGGNPNSPTLITGPDGDVEGLWHADQLGNANDILFAPTLDPTLPSQFAYQNTFWKNNGGLAGGRLMCSDGTIGYTQIGEAHGAWLLGDEEAPGGTADLFGGAWFGSGSVAVTVVFLSSGVGTNLSVPGMNGAFALNVNPLIILGSMAHDARQLASTSVPIPNDPSLSGARLAIQGLSVDLLANVGTFTNNAWIKVR